MKVFLSGIAGTGMSSLAGLMKEKSFDVSGSDNHFYPPTGSVLKEMGVKIFNSFNEKNIPGDVDLCVIGNIISRGNPEAEYILNRSIPYLSMPEALYKFFIEGTESVVVAGTHGKTTISSFLAYLLESVKLSPGYFIGGKPLDMGSGYSVGSGRFFISEGDEYETSFFDRSSKFLKYHPKYLLLSALEYDHIDFFRTPEDYLSSFKNLVNQVPSEGIIIVNTDYSFGREAVKNSFSRIITYGESSADFRIKKIISESETTFFVLSNGEDDMEFRTSLKGEYNVWNLSAGIILGLETGISVNAIRNAVSGFHGVERRLREIRSIKNTVYLEDFAHHPTSINAVLSSLKEIYPEKYMHVFFEPGSWSLKHKMFEERLIKSLGIGDSIKIKSIEKTDKIHPSDRINLEYVKKSLQTAGKVAEIIYSYDKMKEKLLEIDNSEDQIIILLSNGSFGGIPGFISSLNEENY